MIIKAPILSHEELTLGRLVAILGMSGDRQADEPQPAYSDGYDDSEPRPATPKEAAACIEELSMRQFVAVNRGVPLRISAVNPPFIAVTCPCCKDRGSTVVDMRRVEFIAVSDEYARAVSRVHRAAKPWWRKLAFWRG